MIPAAIGLFLLFMRRPTGTLVARGGAEGLRLLGRDHELRDALWLTLGCATAATVIAGIGGTPLAYRLARGTLPDRTVIQAVVDIPLVIPHPVAGIALLLALGLQTT